MLLRNVNFSVEMYKFAWSLIFYVMSITGQVLAQDVAFTPRFDSIEGSDVASYQHGSLGGTDKQLYSFGRFRSEIESVCVGLDEDKRAHRLAEIAAAGSPTSDLTPTYRSLLREFAARCSSRSVVRRGSEKKNHSVGALFDVPYPSRWPSVETLDAASRLSAALYSYDKDSGGIFVAVRRFSSLVLSFRGLSRGEIDYYSTFFKYLQAAWMGRENTDRYQRLANKEESNILFE